MVILINFSKSPFKVEYRDGSKAFVKVIPSNKFVAMKGLRTSEQIKNSNALIKQGVTIWDYERGTFLYRNPGTPATATLPFSFVGDNVKTAQSVTATGYSGTTSKSAMTFTTANAPASVVYGFITSANTVMANNTVTATTIGNNTYISFSGASLSTTNWYNAIAATAFSGFGITVSGYGVTRMSAATTFFLSSTTLDTDSGFAFLQGMV